MAEQQEPVRRMVALKIIKPGMDTRAVVARFEAERQALALMDHPNIARVFDGGVTDSGPSEKGDRSDRSNLCEAPGGPSRQIGPVPFSAGRPYFVMELVKGVPITAFCDKNNSPTEERLRLFIDVCRAVQHAHQKGVIHRDLKPSNIMVTLHDGVPVAKVIDFGVAKALSQRLT
jgi:serine/threonine-protein kinase